MRFLFTVAAIAMLICKTDIAGAAEVETLIEATGTLTVEDDTTIVLKTVSKSDTVLHVIRSGPELVRLAKFVSEQNRDGNVTIWCTMDDNRLFGVKTELEGRLISLLVSFTETHDTYTTLGLQTGNFLDGDSFLIVGVPDNRYDAWLPRLGNRVKINAVVEMSAPPDHYYIGSVLTR